MKKLLSLILAILYSYSINAQRDYRVRPEDYSDNALTESTLHFLDTVSIVVMFIIGLIVGLILLSLHIDSVKNKLFWRKSIKEKTLFYARFNCIASTSKYFTPKKDAYQDLGDYFVPQNNRIHVSGGSECVILEFIDDYRVKVRFKEFQDPIYIHTDYLSPVSKQTTSNYITASDIAAATTRELCKKKHYSYLHLEPIYFIEQNGYVLIPTGTKFTHARDVPPHYNSETKVYFDGYPTPLYVNFTEAHQHPHYVG